MSLDVLIINPGNQRQVYQSLAADLTAKEPPLWANLIASYLRRKNIAVDIMDAEVFDMVPYDIVRDVTIAKPRLVVIPVYGHQPSASTQNMPAAIDTSLMLRMYSDIPVLVLGGHPAALPERTLMESGAHFVCTGEGPRTIKLVVEQLMKAAPRNINRSHDWKADFKEIPGLCFHEASDGGPTIYKTQPVANIQDLAEMPGDCWDLLPMAKYRAHTWHCFGEPSRQPYASIYTSLGCPYACLRGDTPVNTIFGAIPIRELAEKYRTIPIYTYSPATGEVFITDALNIRKTGEQKELVRVHFDDGSHIDCTPDHKFLQFKWGNGKSKSRQWECEAKDLIRGAHVRAIRTEWGFYGRAYITWGRKKRQLRSRLVMEYILGRKLASKEHVHHRDHDKANDLPSNLHCYGSAAEHLAEHPEHAERMRTNNPTKNGMSAQWIENLAAANRGKKRTLASRLKYRESKLGRKNPNFKHGRTVNRSTRLNEVNHSVSFVERLSERDDVYCMEVPATEWFFANDVLVHNCSFCMIQAPFREGDLLKLHGLANSYRMRKPSDVIDQMTQLRERYGVRNIKIADEMFVLNPHHVNAICDGIIGRGLDLNIWAYGRVDTINPKLLPKMKQAGINWLAIGFESASERVRAGVEKAEYDTVDMKEVCRVIREEGINVIGNFIFGLPDDDVVSMQETYAFAEEVMPEFVNMYPCMPYPGSALYRQTLTENPEALPPSWLAYSMHSYETKPLPTKHLGAEEVLKFREDALIAYLSNQRYQAMVERKFGVEARQQVESMASAKLKRKLLGD